MAGPRLEETKRIGRILDIVHRIARAPRQWRRSDLARLYEVSERQIQKDLDIIRHRLKLTLLHEPEGYYFEHIPHLPTVSYSFAEALALLLAARAAQALPGVNSADLAAAIARLESLFPDAFIPLLRQATDRLPRTASAPQRQEMLALLHRALAEGRRVRIVYATGSRGGALTERIVEPYAVMPYVRSWQLIAYDHLRGEVREFKLDRIRQAEVLDEGYSIPADFDLDAYLGDAWGLMRGAAGEPEEVVLLFAPEAGRWVAEEQWHPSQRAETLPDGQVQVTFRIGITPEFVNWVLYYGARARVVQPAHLRQQVVAEHRRAAEAYLLADSGSERVEVIESGVEINKNVVVK